MASIEKALRRDKKIRNKRKHGRDGDSVKLIQEIQIKRREELIKKKREQAIKRRRKQKQEQHNG